MRGFGVENGGFCGGFYRFICWFPGFGIRFEGFGAWFGGFESGFQGRSFAKTGVLVGDAAVAGLVFFMFHCLFAENYLRMWCLRFANAGVAG